MVGFARRISLVVLFLWPIAAGSSACEPAHSETRPHQSVIPRQRLRRAVALSPELQTILQQWEQASSKIQRLDADFTRITYDYTAEVERRGTGSLAADESGRAEYMIKPATLEPGETSKRRKNTGIPFDLGADQPERWHWNGKTLIRINDEHRTFEQITSAFQLAGDDPARSRGSSTSSSAELRTVEFQPDAPPLPDDVHSALQSPDGLLSGVRKPRASTTSNLTGGEQRREYIPTFSELAASVILGIALGQALATLDSGDWLHTMANEYPFPRIFLIGTRAADLKERFEIRLLKQSDTEVWLQFRPTRDDEIRFKQATLILTADTYMPVAIKVVEDWGRASVHVFRDLRINGQGEFLSPLDNPNLTGYRPVSSIRASGKGN